MRLLLFILNVLIYFVNATKETSLTNNNLDEPNEVEFYPTEDSGIIDDSSCSINNSTALVNLYKDVEDLSLFDPEVESQIMHFAVETKRKLLVLYILITKSASQREKILDILQSKYGSTWLKKLKNLGNSFWKTSSKVIKALTTKIEEYNAEMLSTRFEFLTRSYSRLDKILPEALKPLFKIKSKIFNSYMLTEILLESSREDRIKLKNAFFTKYKKSLEDTIKQKLNDKSANFHLQLLNNERDLNIKNIKTRDIKKLIQNATNALAEAKSIKSKSKKVEKLANIIALYPVEILAEAFKWYKHMFNGTIIDVESSSCFRTTIIFIAVKYINDPNVYYANNIKTLLDNKDYGFYLSRIFFAYPKQKLYEIAQTFKQLFKVSLVDYIRSRIDELDNGKLNEFIGRFEAYATYLRALLASLGDLDWCSGNCKVTQIEESVNN